jgi:hypothetical protein
MEKASKWNSDRQFLRGWIKASNEIRRTGEVEGKGKAGTKALETILSRTNCMFASAKPKNLGTCTLKLAYRFYNMLI